MDAPTSVDDVDLNKLEHIIPPTIFKTLDGRTGLKDILKRCVVARVDMEQFRNVPTHSFTIPLLQAALDKKLNPPPPPPKPKSTSRSRGGAAASVGTPARAREDGEEAALEMLAKLRQHLHDTEAAIPREDDDASAAVTATLAERLLSELSSSSDQVNRLLESGRLASTGHVREREERGALLALVAPFGQSQFLRWRHDFKAHHGVDPTVEDLKEWFQGKVEAQDYIDAATRKKWSDAIDEVEAVTEKEVKPTPKNPMVGRGGACGGCQWITAALGRGRKDLPEHINHPCTCATRPPPESVTLEPDEKLLRTADAMTDKLRDLAVEHLQELKRDGKLEKHLQARAVFVVGGYREKMSVTSRRRHQLNPEHLNEARILGHAAQRRIGLSEDRYCLAEGNLDPFSRRVRVLEHKTKTTRRIREWEDSKVDSDDDAATVPTGSTGMYDHEIGFEY